MSETDTDLPKTLIKRIVKRHLNQLDTSDTKRDTQINKDALLAFSESAKIFINYVTATANDICKESKRQTISIDDIFRALEDTDFLELLEPLKQSLEGKAFQNVTNQGCLPTAVADMQTRLSFAVFKKDTKEKNQKKAEAKKRKAEQQLEAEQHGNAEQQYHMSEAGTDTETMVPTQAVAQLAPESNVQQLLQPQPTEQPYKTWADGYCDQSVAADRPTPVSASVLPLATTASVLPLATTQAGGQVGSDGHVTHFVSERQDQNTAQ